MREEETDKAAFIIVKALLRHNSHCLVFQHNARMGPAQNVHQLSDASGCVGEGEDGWVVAGTHQAQTTR